jgi:hypothetical protein
VNVNSRLFPLTVCVIPESPAQGLQANEIEDVSEKKVKIRMLKFFIVFFLCSSSYVNMLKDFY